MKRKDCISCLKDATGITCIRFGLDKSYIDRAIRKTHFIIFLKRTCNQYMILPEDRGMKFGTIHSFIGMTFTEIVA